MKRIISNILCGLALSCPFSAISQSTSVTVTNQNLALVKETRQIELLPGENNISITDIPALIDPTSVFVDITEKDFRVLEQNFEFDLLNSDKILDKAIGAQIQLVDPDAGILRGKLLYASRSDIIMETSSQELRIIPRRQETQIIIEKFGTNDQNWVTHPTLQWLFYAPVKKTVNSKLSYLTRGLTWHAEYIAKLDQNETMLSISAWVSIENTSGKTFPESRLKLIAGDLHLAEQIRPMLARSAGLDEIYQKDFSEKEFFEYHLYTLERKTTLKNNQTKQIQLFSPSELSVKKSYNYNYLKDDKKIRVLLETMNTAENGLGLPLPKGIVRLYKEDGEDLEFIGEDRIDHTAKNEKILIELGKAFDISATRNILKQARLNQHSEQISVSIELRNHKDNDVNIIVTEPILPGRSYQLIKSNIPAMEQDASKINFNVPVKGGESNTLTFDIIFSW
jgi:hypothetical protein